MVFVAVNALTVPEGHGEQLERRFAGRAGLVENSEGFLSFELWRPLSGTSQYLVVTHWEDEHSYQQWLESRQFAEGHGAQDRSTGDRRGPAASDSEIWLFTSVQSTRSASLESE